MVTIKQNGAIIDGLNDNTTLDIKAHDVTIRNSKIDAEGFTYGIRANYYDPDGQPYTGLKVLNTEITGAASAGALVQYTQLLGCEIHECYADGIKAASNTLIDRCFIHHLGRNPSSHADGIQIVYGNRILIRNNDIWMPLAHVDDGYQTNAAIIAQTGIGPINDLTIKDNVLEGGNFTVYMTDKGKGYGPITRGRLIRNKFGRDYQFGTLRYDCGPGMRVRRNRWADTRELMDINGVCE